MLTLVGNLHVSKNALVIKRLDVTHFKAFDRYALFLPETAFLAGPNNAGKSTLIAALRTSARMLRAASRRRPTETFLDRGRSVAGHPFSSSQFGLVDENLRHEFRENETRMSVRFRSGLQLTAIWPLEPEEYSPFFYLHEAGSAITRPDEVKARAPEIGIVPILSPIDHEEEVLTEKHVRDNLDGRLASRHFRNQLANLSEFQSQLSLSEFKLFAEPWLPEFSLKDLDRRPGRKGQYFDFFYREAGTSSEKEIFWAGDGMQIWIQLLLHLYRHRSSDVVILDEPDVFLHPDLQRRLVRLLEALPCQAITATHSAEVLAEAQPDEVVWVDKSRRRSINAPDAVLNELVQALGSHFNIRLARALRSRIALFVEGDDMKLVRHLAESAGASAVAREANITVIPLRGYSNWDRVEPFAWLVQDLLANSVEIYVVLDRDYRTDSQVKAVKTRLSKVGVRAHVWRRKELESYLLHPGTIAARTGLSEKRVVHELTFIVNSLRLDVQTRLLAERIKSDPSRDAASHESELELELDQLWQDTTRALALCPAKEVLSRLNESLSSQGLKAVTFARLARSIDPDAITDEMKTLFERIGDASAAGPGTARRIA